MNKNLILKENNPDKYVVAKLPDGTNFVHDKENGENFFDQKSIRKLTGLGRDTVSYHLKEYKTIANNSENFGIILKVVNSKKPVNFYSFNALTYVAYRSNKPEAIQYRNYVERTLNEKFNKDNGFTQSVKSLEEEALKTIKYLENKVWEETKKAFESHTKDEFIHHMDSADKYSMDSIKRRHQLRNELNCNKRLRRELKLNQEGYLTESTDKRVFIPDNQTTLIEFKITIEK